MRRRKPPQPKPCPVCKRDPRDHARFCTRNPSHPVTRREVIAQKIRELDHGG